MSKGIRPWLAIGLFLSAGLVSSPAKSVIFHIANVDIAADFVSSTVIAGYDSPAQCAILEAVRSKANPFSGPDYYEVSPWNTFYLDAEAGNCPGWAYVGWGHFDSPPAVGYHSARGQSKFIYYSGPDINQVDFDDGHYPIP